MLCLIFERMSRFIVIIAIFLIHSVIYGQQIVDRIPIDIVENFVFIKVKVNNSSESLNFMFDTGAGVTVINENHFEKLDLKIHENTQIGTAGKSLNSRTSNHNRITLGEKIILDSLSLYLMNLTHLENFLKTRVDGIIGFDLLNERITQTNIDTYEMLFFSDSNFKYLANAKPIGLVILESNHFGVPIEIFPKGDKKSLSLIVKIDTGADNYLTFHNNAVKKYDLLKSDKKYKKRIGFSVDSTKTTNLKGKVASATLGSKKWKNVPTIFEIDTVNNSSKRKADGLIGQELLLDFNICYNLKENVIYLENRK